MKNIIDTVTDAGTFKNLIIAVQQADLVDSLSSDGPFTIFAPNDKAFEKLTKEKLDKLLLDKERLTDFLTYHVVADEFMYKNVTKMKQAKTINGKNINIRNSSTIRINKARILQKDIKCSNGVIHEIDQVLLPEEEKE